VAVTVVGFEMRGVAMKRSIFVLLAAAGLGLCLPRASFAQWVHVPGPGGCRVDNLIAVGTSLFADTEWGLFRSSDNGASWTAVDRNAVKGTVLDRDTARRGVIRGTQCLAEGATNIFAMTHDGFLRSTDGGATWSRLTAGLPKNPNVICLAIIGAKIFAGVGAWTEDTGPGGLYLSTDTGESWKRVHGGLPEQLWVGRLVVSGEYFFAGTDHGVFLSTDNGESWKAISAGLPGGPWADCFAANGRNLFTGFGFSSPGSGIFRSTDNGKSWEPANSGLPPFGINDIAIIGPNVFVGTEDGVFLSTDNGKSWRPVNSGLPESDPVLSLAEAGANIFAGIFDYRSALFDYDIPPGKVLYHSDDGGATWTAVSCGLPQITCFEANETNLFAGTYRGLYRSDDNGASWRPVKTGLPAKAVITFLAASGTRLFAATDEGVVYSSTDSGASWSAFRSRGWPEKAKVLCLVADGPGLYAGIHLPLLREWPSLVEERTAQQDTGLGIYLTTDRDRKWKAMNSGLPGDPRVSCLAVRGPDLYAGLLQPAVIYGKFLAKPKIGLGIFRSVNGGKTWAASSSGLPANTIVNCLVISGANVIAGTAGKGVFLSRDKGKSWTALNSGLPPESNVLCCTTSKKSLYISINDHGIWHLPLSALK
jgi:photosystem II stability/assembly factor-like uncharacterized protein